ncbi:MAG: hypothetical protein V7749_08435 [Cocleimonas sp.]
MSTKDQVDFLEIAGKYCDSIVEESPFKLLVLNVGSCKLLFTPSILEGNTLFIGKLEIRLSEFSDSLDIRDHERSKLVFRKCRNWLKKYYWSRLAYLNQNKKGKLTPSRNHWLGPDAKLWKEIDEGTHLLKLSQTSWMVFELGY